jgi:hypothetical protein
MNPVLYPSCRTLIHERGSCKSSVQVFMDPDVRQDTGTKD